MNVRETYPDVKRRGRGRQTLMTVCKWAFPAAGFICVLLNILIAGKAWSAIVAWSLWIAWAQIVSPDLVEFNRISQLIKLVINSCILLVLIDLLLTPGWAVEVVPIVCFSSLLITGVLFFTDLEKQKQNMMPMLFMSAACLVGAVIGLILWHGEGRWTLAVMGASALLLPIGCFARLGREFWVEFKKRFCAK